LELTFAASGDGGSLERRRPLHRTARPGLPGGGRLRILFRRGLPRRPGGASSEDIRCSAGCSSPSARRN
jgi:hypothetical protein